ncbi:hypothetical protein Tco_1577291 [Tanacetum coccineum]
MATPIDFSKYAMNRLKIENLTQAHLVGPVYELLKGTCTSNIKLECTSNIELEYNMEECFKALTDKLDWNNPDGDRCPFDLTKPLPLKGCPGRLTVAVEYFFNKDLEFLKSSYPKKGYTTSIMKTKSARYEIVGIEYMVPTICSTTKVGYNKDTEKGIKHWSDKHQLWYRSQLNKFSKHKVYSTQNILNVVSVNFKKMHGYGHLEEIMVRRADRQLYKFKKGDFVKLIVALRMFTKSLIIKRRVEDLQLGVESYQKKLNLTKPQMTFPGIEFKEPYTSSFNPPSRTKQKREQELVLVIGGVIWLGYGGGMGKGKVCVGLWEGGEETAQVRFHLGLASIIEDSILLGIHQRMLPKEEECRADRQEETEALCCELNDQARMLSRKGVDQSGNLKNSGGWS